MSKKSKEVRYRMVPPEFARMPQDKEELVRQIRAHRARLMVAVPPHHTEDKSEGGAELLLSSLLSDEVGVFPRSEIMRYVRQNPKRSVLSAAVCVSVVAFIMPKLLRRIGYKRLLRWGGVLSPLVLTGLEKMQAAKKLKPGKSVSKTSHNVSNHPID